MTATCDDEVEAADSGSQCAVRAGWAKASRKIAEAGVDELIMVGFGNLDDSALRRS